MSAVLNRTSLVPPILVGALFAIVLGSVGVSEAQVHGAPVLPGVPAPEELASNTNRVLVKAFVFQGNTVFPTKELSNVLTHFVGHSITSSELEKARQLISYYYIDSGYFNSGALLPDQKITNGVITFQIVEGTLAEVNVRGNLRLRSRFVEDRIRRLTGKPLNYEKLTNSLLLLSQYPSIDGITADIQPRTKDGEKVQGESVLDVKITETPQFHLELTADNQRPPSAGAGELGMLASYRNLIGYNDAIEVTYGIIHRSANGVDFSGLDNLAARYAIPFTVYDTTLEIGYRRADYAIIEEPFQELSIKSESEDFGITIRQPVLRTLKDAVTLTLAAERRRAESTLEDVPFSFSPGAINGESAESVLRFGVDWVRQSTNQVLATRLTASWGLDALGATANANRRDGRFFSLQGQAQYVRRLWDDLFTPSQLILRTSFQWANDPLLSMEEYPIGGLYSVRGYQENQLVRDTAVLASAELRVPVWRGKKGVEILQLAPFFDFGAGRNEDAVPDAPPSIASAGIGLIFQPHERVSGLLYWGHPFRDLPGSTDHNLQDYGIHFRLTVKVF